MEPEKTSNGALVGAIIVVLILVLGGIYYWTTKVSNAPLENTPTSETEYVDDGTPLTEEELGAIEAELGTEVDLGTSEVQ